MILTFFGVVNIFGVEKDVFDVLKDILDVKNDFFSMLIMTLSMLEELKRKKKLLANVTLCSNRLN